MLASQTPNPGQVIWAWTGQQGSDFEFRGFQVS